MPRWEPRSYTYADYLGWDEGLRIELLDGVPYSDGVAWPTRSYTSSAIHQEVLRNLACRLADALEDTPYRVLHRPTCVRMEPGEDNGDRTVLEPDLVVFERSKRREYGCGGVPELVVEVVSPSSLLTDCLHKFRVYGKAGVGDYWMVYLEHRFAQRFVLEGGGGYRCTAYGAADRVCTELPGGVRLEVDLGRVFAGIE